MNISGEMRELEREETSRWISPCTNDTRNIAEETCLVPAAEGEEERVPNTSSFNFITDIFFLAHKCLDLGFRVVQEKFIKLNQELNRTQELYR